jgi:hypothetical protein
MVDYDPVCHCGIPLSTHSVYDNHPFTEMETQESMQYQIDKLREERDALRSESERLAAALDSCPHAFSCESMKRANVPLEMCTCWRKDLNIEAILTARDSRMRREGAAAELEQLAERVGSAEFRWPNLHESALSYAASILEERAAEIRAKGEGK